MHTAPLTIELERCTLRPLRPGDAPSLAVHANDRDVWRNLRDRFPHPYTEADAHAWIALSQAGGAIGHFAIDVGGAVVGGIGVEFGSDIDRRTGELGYWLGRAYWGRGIATEAVGAVTAWAFRHHDLVRLEAGVLAWNPASMRVLEKAGYHLEARLALAATKDGETVDRFLYVRLRDDVPPAPH